MKEATLTARQIGRAIMVVLEEFQDEQRVRADRAMNELLLSEYLLSEYQAKSGAGKKKKRPKPKKNSTGAGSSSCSTSASASSFSSSSTTAPSSSSTTASAQRGSGDGGGGRGIPNGIGWEDSGPEKVMDAGPFMPPPRSSPPPLSPVYCLQHINGNKDKEPVDVGAADDRDSAEKAAYELPSNRSKTLELESLQAQVFPIQEASFAVSGEGQSVGKLAKVCEAQLDELFHKAVLDELSQEELLSQEEYNPKMAELIKQREEAAGEGAALAPTVARGGKSSREEEGTVAYTPEMSVVVEPMSASAGIEADLRVVQDWLASMVDPGTGATVIAHFREEDIGLEALVELNTHELREFGVTKLGWQKTLQHKARHLLTDRRALSQQLDHVLPSGARIAGSDSRRAHAGECVICLQSTGDLGSQLLVLLPCRHRCCCVRCCQDLKKCPLCRTLVQSSISIFDP